MPETSNLAVDPSRLRVCAYPRALRLAAGGLLVVSGASLPVLLGRALLVGDPPVTPAMVRAFLALSALPALAAALVGRTLVAKLVLTPGTLEITVGGQRFAVPLASIAAVEPWRVPLPQPGLALRLASGEPFALGIGAADPAQLVERLVAAGVVAAAPALVHPTLVYARAKDASGRLGWRRLLVKYPLFGALVGAVLFNAQQHIAYGGSFGQYELEGVLPYAKTFVTYWVTVTIYLVIYASLWRWPAEIVAWLAARRGERVAATVRRAVELVCRLAYYAGIPAMLALRFAS